MKILRNNLFFGAFLLASCSSSSAVINEAKVLGTGVNDTETLGTVTIEIEKLNEIEPNGQVPNVSVFDTIEEVSSDYVEVANLKSVLFEENDPEQQILEAFKNKAKELGANAVVLQRNEYSIQARRDMNVGGITTGIERSIEAVAIFIL